MNESKTSPIAKIKSTLNKPFSELPMHEPLQEGEVTLKVENQSAKIPSLAWLALAGGSMALSAIFYITGKKQASQFVGAWAPSFMLIGVYNKLVKIEHTPLEEAPKLFTH